MSGILGDDIEKIISGVKRAVTAAKQSEGGGQKFAIDRLELTLKGLVEKNVGGELKIKIPVIDTGFGAKADVTSKELQTIQLTLVPIKSMTRSSIRSESFEKELVEAIRAIREGIKNAAENEPKFTLQDAFVELNFVLNSKGEIAFLAKGSGQSEAAQTIRLYIIPVDY
jgi:hypothetical protein